MERKAVSGIMLTLLLVGMLTLAFNVQPVKAEPGAWTVDGDGPADFSSIQEAINSPDVKDGDTIYVYNGTYYENLVVSKTVSLIGEDKHNTIIDGSDTGTVINVTANNVNITGFTIQNGGPEYPESGICVYFSNGHNISNNIITNNNSFGGVHFLSSGNNTVSGNNITANSPFGIGLIESSNYNNVSGNSITNNMYGIFLAFSNYNIISGNNIANNGYGMVLGYSSNISISGNDITANNGFGIDLTYSSDNSISGNNIANNQYGICLYSSSYNEFYHNNFIDNTQQVYISMSGYANFWDDGYPSGGNCWSDHVTVDDCCGINQDEPVSDGIVDEPYIIDDYSRDNYPLVEPWSPLPRTIVELKAEIQKCWSEGEIDNQGIVKSLIAKLDVAERLVDMGRVNAAHMVVACFIIQVQKLSEICITVEAADLLVKSAEYILSQL